MYSDKASKPKRHPLIAGSLNERLISNFLFPPLKRLQRYAVTCAVMPTSVLLIEMFLAIHLCLVAEQTKEAFFKT